MAFWVSDSDQAIAEAESAASRAPTSLREGGARARAKTGESEPLVALQDALATYQADRVLVFVREEDGARYREDDVLGEAQRRFGVPVTEIARRPSGAGSPARRGAGASAARAGLAASMSTGRRRPRTHEASSGRNGRRATISAVASIASFGIGTVQAEYWRGRST